MAEVFRPYGDIPETASGRPMTEEEKAALVEGAWQKERATLTLACPRYPVSKLKGIIPQRFFDALEQNQKIASCCRHPENHDIEAFKSSPGEKVPDIYIFHCTCGRRHRRFCVGGGDERPFWEVK